MSGSSSTDALWVWYITSKDEIIKPAEITVYGADGHLIYGGSKEEKWRDNRMKESGTKKGWESNSKFKPINLFLFDKLIYID